MKKLLLPASVLLISFTLTGCLVFTVERKNPPAPQVPPAPEVVVVPSTTADSVAVAEIDAAGRLDFENSRFSALNTIAVRTNLSATAQICLVNHAFKRLDFENNKVALLQTVINNPSFCNAAKQTLLGDINKLSFDNNRAALLASINQRGELKE